MNDVPVQTPGQDDPTWSHHRGDACSQQAWHHGNKENWVELSYLAILTAGPQGATPEQVASYWSSMLGHEVTVLTIRPRFTSLLKEGRIRKTSETRESLLGVNSRVCVATIYDPQEYVDTRVERPLFEPEQIASLDI